MPVQLVKYMKTLKNILKANKLAEENIELKQYVKELELKLKKSLEIIEEQNKPKLKIFGG